MNPTSGIAYGTGTMDGRSLSARGFSVEFEAKNFANTFFFRSRNYSVVGEEKKIY